ncbi:MAG: GtrA family protein [Clostridiales bacterium]
MRESYYERIYQWLKEEGLIQFIKFGLVGVCNTATSLLIYYFITWWNSSLYFLGNALGWVVSVAVSYILNRFFVFKNSNLLFWQSFLKSYISYASTFFLSSLLLLFFVELIGISKGKAPILALAITVPINYILAKYWTFRSET